MKFGRAAGLRCAIFSIFVRACRHPEKENTTALSQSGTRTSGGGQEELKEPLVKCACRDNSMAATTAKTCVAALFLLMAGLLYCIGTSIWFMPLIGEHRVIDTAVWFASDAYELFASIQFHQVLLCRIFLCGIFLSLALLFRLGLPSKQPVSAPAALWNSPNAWQI